MVTPIQNPTIWLLDDGRLGHLKQSQALLNAMLRQSDGQSKPLQAMSVETIPVHLPRWQQWLAPRILLGADRQLNDLPQGEPAMVIGAGSHCALYSRLIKRRYPNTFNIQILDPRFARQDFSVLIIPEHDQVEGDNVITMRGSLVDIPKPASDDEDIWPGGDAPKLAVLLAGNMHENQRLLQLAKQQTQAGKVQCVISLAPRTSMKQVQADIDEGQDLQHHFITNSKEYRQALCTADQYWVAGDSINQLSEVLTVKGEKPIWVAYAALGKRHLRFIDDLLSRSEVQLLSDYPKNFPPPATRGIGQFWQQQTGCIANRVLALWGRQNMTLD